MQDLDFDALYGVSKGRHFYQFYKSSEDYLKVLIAYFRAGLEKGDACLWLVSRRMGVERVYEECQARIPGFSEALASGRFQMRSAEDWYLTLGRFDEARALDNARQYLEEITSAGYKVLRGAGDAGAIPHEDWPLLHSYEEKIDEFIHRFQAIGLCAYPIFECSITDTRHVLERHDGVLVGKL